MKQSVRRRGIAVGIRMTVFSTVVWCFFSGPVRSDATAPVFTGLAPEIWTGKVDTNDIMSFKGLPFAAPPTGEYRWRAPGPYLPLPGRRSADQFQSACMQGPHTVNWYQDLIKSLGEDPALFSHPVQGYSEDCLYLNIWARAIDENLDENLDENVEDPSGKVPSAAMPVMVWIHGGSNKGGWPFEPDYRGQQLARHGVVVVSVPYRLGIYGFFSHPDLVEEQGGGAANYGLLDLIAALKWIQLHISAFGGDPGNVTVFGESSGAANIGYLMSSPDARGLFHRAIHQSAGFEVRASGTLDNLTAAGLDLAKAADVEGIAALRELSAEQLLAIVEQHQPDRSFGPVKGGHALPRLPAEVFGAGEQAAVPLMIGTNANEWLMYIGKDDSLESYAEGFGVSEDLPVIRRHLAGQAPIRQMDRLATAAQMLCPSYDMASAVSGAGQEAYVYQLNRVREASHWQSVGAYHGAEIPYVFDSHASWLSTTETDIRLSRQIMGYWTQFAISGSPNGDGLPRWDAWQARAPAVVSLDDQISMLSAPDQLLCRLFDG